MLTLILIGVIVILLIALFVAIVVINTFADMVGGLFGIRGKKDR